MSDTNGNLALMPKVQMQPQVSDWDTEEKLDLLRRTYAKDLSKDEFALYVEHCRQLDLNPLTKQCQPLKFSGQLSFHTTIHGLVAIACRSGAYAGIDPVRFDTYPHQGKPNPNIATCTVYKMVQGQRCAFTAEVYWSERNRGQAGWNSQKWTMLGKCAQSAAIRLGFEEVKGLYIEEELPVAVEGTVVAQVAKASEPEFLPPDGKTWPIWIAELARDLGIFDDGEALKDFMQELTGTDPRKVKYAPTEYSLVAHRLQEMLWEMRKLDEGEGLAKTVEAE